MSESNPQKKTSSMIQRCITGAVLVALLAAGNLSFWLCDRALAALTRYYHLVVKPKLKKKF